MKSIKNPRAGVGGLGEKNCPAVRRDEMKMVDPTCVALRSRRRGVRDGGLQSGWGEELDACMLLSSVANTVELGYHDVFCLVEAYEDHGRIEWGGLHWGERDVPLLAGRLVPTGRWRRYKGRSE